MARAPATASASITTTPPVTEGASQPTEGESVNVALELLKEAGLCIRTSWVLINNLVRSFLYLNLILFTIFGVSLRGFDVAGEMIAPSNPTANQSQAASNDQRSSTAPTTPVKPNPVPDTQRAEIIKFLSFLVCGLGILGPIFAAFLLHSMINYGQRFLSAANKLEEYIFSRTNLKQEEIGFYKGMSERYERSLNRWGSVVYTAPLIFGLFTLAWLILLLRAFDFRYITVLLRFS